MCFRAFNAQASSFLLSFVLNSPCGVKSGLCLYVNEGIDHADEVKAHVNKIPIAVLLMRLNEKDGEVLKPRES